MKDDFDEIGEPELTADEEALLQEMSTLSGLVTDATRLRRSPFP